MKLELKKGNRINKEIVRIKMSYIDLGIRC